MGLRAAREEGEGEATARDLEPQLLQSGMHPSVYQVTRHLKRERNSLFNCMRSIIDDAAFVEEVASRYPTLPVLANLRCGRWYTPSPEDTCYYKSTDGHDNGRWNFSLVRLNMHVAQLAARRGGVMIVDATRNNNKGGFPDSLSKTIPIWCAVLNRAVARCRAANDQGVSLQAPPGLEPGPASCSMHPGTGTQTQAPSDGHTGTGRPGQPGTTTISLLPESGGLHIEQADSTTPVDVTQGPADCGAWDCTLHLPVWISRNEALHIEAKLDMWVDNLMATSTTDVTALAQVLTRPLRPLWVSQNTRTLTSSWVQLEVPQPEELSFAPLVLVTASKPVHMERRPCPLSRQRAAQAAADGQEESDHQIAMYMYLAGAGDDEESWAGGLTPELLWSHQQELLEASPSELPGVVSQLVRRFSSPEAAHNAALQRAQQAKAARGPAPTDEYHLAPLGCRAAVPGQTHHLGGGAYSIQGTQLAVGGWTAGLPPAVWSRGIQAVLYLGLSPHTTECGSTVSEQQRYKHLLTTHDKHGPQSLKAVLPEAVPWVMQQIKRGHTVLIHDDSGVDICVSVCCAVILADRPTTAGTTKEDVRVALATVASSYPQSRPTRSLLKQVFGYFHPSTAD